MSFVTGEFVQVWIDGTERTEYVIDYERVSSLCELGDTFTLTLSPEYPVDIDPYMTVLVKENYQSDSGNVLRGYVVDISQSFDPGAIVITGQDKSIRLFDYFIPQQLISSGQSVDYWIEYIASLAGLDVYFSSTSPAVVSEETMLGMQTAADAILSLERLGAYYTRYDSALDKLVVFRLDTSEPKITINKQKTLTALRDIGTDKTRNVVKVYGGYTYDPFTNTSEQIFVEARTEIPELLVDKAVVVANPVLNRQTYAYIVANTILSMVNSLDDVQQYEIVGFHPDIKVGDYAYINLNEVNYNYHGDKKITTVQANVNTKGVITTIVVGEKCNRISINLPIPPVYVTTTDDGVGISWNGGDSFIQSNTGLTTSGELYGKNIAVNGYSHQMVITAAGIYRRYSPGDTWVSIGDLPAPTNEALDGVPTSGWVENLNLIKVVEEPSKYYTFHVLASAPTASGDTRYWVYTTKDFGTNWSSMEIWIPTSGTFVQNPGAPSGRLYDCIAQDIETGLNNYVFVLASGRVTVIEELVPDSIYYAEFNTSATTYLGYWDGTTQTQNGSVTCSGYIAVARMWSCPTDRNICYWAAISNDGPTTAYRGAHTYVARTTDGGASWSLVHDEAFIADSNTAMISSYSVNIDPSSTESSVRIGFCGFNHMQGNNDVTAKARFVTSNPGGSTSYTDDSSGAINLTTPTLGGGESFTGYNHLDTYSSVTFNTGFKNSAKAGYMYATAGFYGAIFNPSRNDTSRVGLIVELNFSTESVSEYSQYQWRGGDTNNTPAQCHVYSADSGGVYATLNRVPSTAYVNGGWNFLSGTTGAGENDFNRGAGETMLLMHYTGVFTDDYETRDTSGTDTATTFYPKRLGTNRPQTCSINKQIDAGDYHWCMGTTTLGTPDGFCYTADGVNWTQQWSANYLFWDFAWRTFE